MKCSDIIATSLYKITKINNKDGKKFPIEINKHKQAFSQVKFELFINNLVYSQPWIVVSLYSHNFLDPDCGLRNFKCGFVTKKFKEMGPVALSIPHKC